MKHIETLYDELIKNYNQANEGLTNPMAQLHNDSGMLNFIRNIILQKIVKLMSFLAVYSLLGIHMLETVAKPMLQMLETQCESSTKMVQRLQAKLEQTSIDDDNHCDGKHFEEERTDELELENSALNIDRKSKKLNSSMVSSPV